MSRERKKPKIGIKVSDHKGPKTIEHVPGQKEPLIAQHINVMQTKASWRVKKIQMAAPYGWHELTNQEVSYIRQKLADFESMTWHEIFTVAKKRNHCISVAELRCPEAKRWLRENLPDQTELWTLRFSGTQRVWGIFAEGAYQIIFWDPLHQIMPTLQ
jgi:hypothetical protein